MPSSKPLRGHCVVEVGNSVAGPYAGLILAELGADVIKIESPNGGDFARGWGPPFWDGSAPHFVALNRGQALDHGRARRTPSSATRSSSSSCATPTRSSSTCVPAWRPSAASARRSSSRSKPSLVYCDIGAFGRGGPLSRQARLRPADAGVRRPHEHHRRGRDAPADPRAGLDDRHGRRACGRRSASSSSLLEREKTGRGGVVETSLFETALAYETIQIASVTIAPRQMKPQGSGASGIVPYQAFRASDGWIVIGGGNDGLFAKLVKALGRPSSRPTRAS